VRATTQTPELRAALPESDGPERNERLTTTSATLLVLLLAVEGITLLMLGTLLRVHMFVGLMLIPPVALKLASTGYRFVRYYSNAAPYRTKGPPQLALRLLAPVLVAATVAVLGSGVWLLLLGHRSDAVLQVHKIAFIVWGVLFVVHFLAYVPQVVRSLARRADGRLRPGARAAAIAVLTALVAGALLALVALPQIRGWTGG
jgi:hypothetical protein